MKTQEFYSRGKLLLSGEYAVIHGAAALAVPLKTGQWMRVEESPGQPYLHWEAQHPGGTWFRATFRMPALEVMETTDEKTALFLIELMRQGSAVGGYPLPEDLGYTVTTRLEFDRHWGLGSSSSLISNVAYWLQADPFELFKLVSRGSGYDVFCSRADSPIKYKLVNGKPQVRALSFRPDFRQNIFFIYLGAKQDSQQSVEQYHARKKPGEGIITEITRLTEEMIGATSLEGFQLAMKRHEVAVSEILEKEPVKSVRFPDFPGEVKSLGAWGGDYVMAASSAADHEIKEYFMSRNFPVIFEYDDLVL